MNRLQQLVQRKLVQWVLAYAALAWAVLEVVDFLTDRFAWPDAIIRALTVILAVGCLAVLVVAWFHGEKGEQRVSRLEVGLLVALTLIAGVGAVMVGPAGPEAQKFSSPSSSPPALEGSLAVLPFANLSGDVNEEYFSDGITEELLNALANVEGLRVSARTSAWSFKDKHEDIREIAKALSVRHVLEGSVRRSGNRVRITAQLIDAGNGYHMWSQTYDRELSDILAVQENIARSIVGALRIRLLPARQERLLTGGTNNPAAYEAYLRGMAALARTTRERLKQAIDEFETAIRIDPAFARGYAGLARARLFDMWDYDPKLAANAARRALQLDSALGEPHAVLASLAADNFDWKAAEEQFGQGLRKEPGAIFSYYWYAEVLVPLDRRDEAIALAERVVAIDPLSPFSHFILGSVLYHSGKYEAAYAAGQRGLALDSLANHGHWLKGFASLLLRDYERAIASLERTAELQGQAPRAGIRTVVEAIAAASGTAGYAVQRSTALDVVREWERTGAAWPSALPTFYLLLKDREAVCRVFGREVDKRTPEVSFFAGSAVFDSMRSEPCFVAILKRMHLPTSLSDKIKT